MGNFSQAIKYYQQALAIAQKHQAPIDKIQMLLKLGSTYLNLGDTAQGIDSLKQSLAVAQTFPDRQPEAQVLVSLGVAYLKTDLPSEAIAAFERSLAIARQIKDADSERLALGNLGDTYYILDDLKQALNAYQQQLAVVRQNKDRRSQGEALHKLGLTLARSGDLKAAADRLFESADVWDALRPRLDHIDQVSLFEQQARTYNILQGVLVAQSRVDDALEVSERGRARAFVNLLTQRLATTPDATNIVTNPTLGQIQQIAKEQNTTLVEYSVSYDPLNLQGKEQWRQSELYIWVIVQGVLLSAGSREGAG